MWSTKFEDYERPGKKHTILHGRLWCLQLGKNGNRKGEKMKRTEERNSSNLTTNDMKRKRKERD
jgi:hypothetical protein